MVFLWLRVSRLDLRNGFSPLLVFKKVGFVSIFRGGGDGRIFEKFY